MQTYEIPRNYKGEGRILYIFSTKALIYTAIGVGIGLIFYFILNIIGLSILGIIISILFGVIGFSIATFKVPDSKKFKITEKTGGENIDTVILRYIKFKQKKNRIYVNIKEETKDE
ncbi:MAG: PrgI family protein [Clostridia bacterium]|nr:PrgI family protein [Clostridia bacterium]